MRQNLREKLPLRQRIQNTRPPLIQLLQLLQPVPDAHDFHLIQLPRPLLPIPRDKRHRPPLLQQHRRSGHLSGLNSEFLGDFEDVLFDHEDGKGCASCKPRDRPQCRNQKNIHRAAQRRRDLQSRSGSSPKPNDAPAPAAAPKRGYKPRLRWPARNFDPAPPRVDRDG